MRFRSRSLLTSSLLLVSISAPADFILDNDFLAPPYTESGFWTTSGEPVSGTGPTDIRRAREPGQVGIPGFRKAGGMKRSRCSARARTGPDVRYTIRHAGGTAEVPVNQYAGSSKMEEVSLGEYDFDAGSEGFVRLDSVMEGKVCVADAVIFRSNRDDPPMILLADRSPVRL